MLLTANLNGTSEFLDNVGQWVLGGIYHALYWACEKEWNGMFFFLDWQIGDAANTLQQTPDTWNFQAYTIIRTIANNAIVPLAACFIAILFAWELVHLLQDVNQMRDNAIFDRLIVLVVMTGVTVYLTSHSFDIVMFFFKLGTNVTDKITDVSNLEVSFQNIDLEAYLPSNPDRYTLISVFELFGYIFILAFGNIAVMILGVLVYIRVTIWFLEFLLYASVAAIPNSTWMNKEWSQVGMNYTRKMLAVAFEGPLMLLTFAMYGFILKGINMGNFTQSLMMIVGCGFALFGMMCKVGNISSSIFNAH